MSAATPVLRRRGRAIGASMKSWPELVIFDCDGVLVDSEAIALARTRAALARVGLRASAKTEARDLFLGVSAAIHARHRRARLGAPLPPDFQRRTRARHARGVRARTEGRRGNRGGAGAARRPSLRRLVELARAHPRFVAHRRLRRSVRAERVFGRRSRARQARARSLSARRAAHGRRARPIASSSRTARPASPRRAARG